MDYAHSETDKLLEDMERRVAAVYNQASKETKEKLKKWYKQFEKADAEKRELLDSGKITKEQYIGWRKDEIAKKKHLQAIVNQLTDDFVKSDKIAMEIVSGSAPDVFALNANYTAYDIERKSGAEMPWTMYDRQTVNRLIRENPQLLPMPSVDIPLDTHWNHSHITNAITQGILHGEAIPDIAKRLERVANMDYNTAVRSARTATTAAECAGRTHVYKSAESMGIELEQEWLATLDGRTRHAHRQLDGQRVPVGKPFQIDGYEIEYPGDPKAPGYLIYNCRCTTVAVLKGDTQMGTRSARNPETGKWETVPYTSYQEWEAKKRAENPTALDLYMKKSANYSTDQRQWNEYRDILGKEVPNTLDKFQNLKYNEPEKWNQLQTTKHQTVFVNNAPCETTKKKYSGYFLKEGAKHADQFFDVGYTANDVLQLRYDMAKQFDMSKAVEFRDRSGGARTFNIYMELGITKKRTFATSWMEDSPGATPRIITAFRKNKEDSNDK